MQTFTQSEADSAKRRFFLHLVDATDGLTPETGEAGGQPQISKNGGAFANTGATLSAVGNGLYYVALTAGELDTLGKVVVRYKSANTAEFQDVGMVYALDLFKATVNPADGGITAAAIATDAVNEIADGVLSRPISNVEGSAAFRTLAGAIAKLVNRVAVAASTLTVYKSDDATSFGTQAVTTDAAADPITEVNTT